MIRGDEMSFRLRFQVLGLAVLAGSLQSSFVATARAQDDSPSRVLFKEGRALASEGKYEQACPKFEAALALEVGVGTQFNLADCWEHIGRNASAQKLFLGAAASAKAAGQADREQVLRERAAALEPRISKLVIDVSDTSPRLSIKRDELPLEQEQWGKALPIDAGEYELSAKAPGKKPWHTTVVVKPGAPVVTVEVPTLEALEEKPEKVEAVAKPAATAKSGALTAPNSEPPRDRSSSGPNYRALGLGGVSVVALAVGTVMGVRYKSNNDDAKAICPSNVDCTPKQIDDHDRLVDKARNERAWMFAGVGVGALSLAGAAALYLFDKPHGSAARVRALPALGQNEVGASVVGQF
jgi:tetratricopeptide (TPR) repeat protein